MSKNPINKKTISKIIKTTQAIEGYAEAEEATVQEVRSLRKKHGIKVSTRK